MVKEEIKEIVNENIKEIIEENKNIDNKKKKTNTDKTETKKGKKKKVTIFGYSITKILLYFVIYSIIGFVIETLFALLTKGVLESRKSFLYGPFCAIYGVGAVIMIIGLKKFNKNNYTLFFGGFLIGSIVEYLISWIGEMIFDVKWWDYSNMPFNINGRICIWYSLFWGVLAIYLVTHIHPKIDKFLDKFSSNILKIIAITFVIIMFIDWGISSFAMKMFFVRLVKEHNVELQEVDISNSYHARLYENTTVKQIVNTLFSDEIMLKAFPNLKVTEKDGEVILVRDILDNIQPYYFRVFTPPRGGFNINNLFDQNKNENNTIQMQNDVIQ